MTASSPDLAPVREGDILDGKYRVEKVLGAGGMGVVVAATHVQLHTRVALKFLLPAAMNNPQVVERFAREARAAVRIQSEHVARVTDVGTLPSGSPYMVMEYLEGGDLSDTLAKGGPLPVPQAVGYVLQACEAIAEAHALGIVHRDLKPANLFLARRTGRDSIVKVLDFGISKTGDGGPSGLTQTASMMGSPYYMAPEQMMSSKDVDARADIWALGIILYELLAGAPPFVADTMPEIVFMVTQRDAPPLQSRRPDVPPELGGVVSRCLSRDRAARYPNVAKLAAAIAPFGPPRSDISLERITRILGTSAPPPPDSPVAPVGPMQATSSTWANSQAGLPVMPLKARVMAAAAGALVLLGLTLLVWRFVRGPSDTARADRAAQVAASPPAASVLGSPAPPNAPAAAPTGAPAPAAPSSAAILAPLPEALPEPPPKEPGPGAAKPAASAAASVATHPPPLARPRAAQPPTTTPPPAPAANRGLNMGMKE